MPRVLLTGSGGFLGKALSQKLREHDWEIVPILRTANNDNDALCVDFQDPSSCIPLLKLPPCDAIIHLASHVDLSADAKEGKFFPTAIFATSLLAGMARSWNAHLILASSIAVYGNKALISNEQPVAPQGAYARSKLLAEQIVTQSDVPFTIFRFCGLFGLGGPSHLMLNRAIERGLKDGHPPVCHGKGEAKRNYLYVHDAADFILKALEHQITGIHLAAGNTPMTISEMLQTIIDVYTPGAELQFAPRETPETDCIVVPSTAFQMGRTFASALNDIQASVLE